MRVPSHPNLYEKVGRRAGVLAFENRSEKGSCSKLHFEVLHVLSCLGRCCRGVDPRGLDHCCMGINAVAACCANAVGSLSKWDDIS